MSKVLATRDPSIAALFAATGILLSFARASLLGLPRSSATASAKYRAAVARFRRRRGPLLAIHARLYAPHASPLRALCSYQVAAIEMFFATPHPLKYMRPKLVAA
jgi:hypothetical protein